ncbi:MULTISPECIES: hypothetical protein [unclassified Thioalkalivibrio]|uniref:hypothetical protein n=1 Tax=unclassified Thioalkalivibrio TaxID=2621013 RepID=UPI001E35AB40|nr:MULTISPECIES: hypothetical protein [unclassified Thioalkalivibrio]
MIEAHTVFNSKAPDAREQRKGGLPFAFIRGNVDAEMASGGAHEGHEDAAWNYEVSVAEDGTPWIRGLNRDGMEEDIAPTPLHEFCNAHRDHNETPYIVIARESGLPNRVTLATHETAEAIARAYELDAAKFPPENVNHQSSLDRAGAWWASLAIVRKKEMESQVDEQAEPVRSRPRL